MERVSQLHSQVFRQATRWRGHASPQHGPGRNIRRPPVSTRTGSNIRRGSPAALSCGCRVAAGSSSDGCRVATPWSVARRPHRCTRPPTRSLGDGMGRPGWACPGPWTRVCDGLEAGRFGPRLATWPHHDAAPFCAATVARPGRPSPVLLLFIPRRGSFFSEHHPGRVVNGRAPGIQPTALRRIK